MTLNMNPAEAPASQFSIPDVMEHALRRYTADWWAADPQSATDPQSAADPEAAPDLGRTYAPREQAALEGQLQRLVEAVLAVTKNPPHTSAEREATQARLGRQAGDLLRAVLGPGLLEALPTARFSEAVAEFVRLARAFDPALSLDDIFQAGRNAWTMNGLQWLMGLPVAVTPAVVAYSLLYPYTDNLLDDPALSRESKAHFNARFRRRLAGEAVTPASGHEQKIFDLVGLIEGQFARPAFPQVFDSLLAIHQAQGQSLKLMRPGAAPYELDVLGVNFAKGGASVLADGYLVAGTLSRTQAEFLYGYGAFVQLVDDLEDVPSDFAAGRLSFYSLAAGRWPLDRLADRTFHFGRQVLAHLADLNPSLPAPVQTLIRTGANLLLVDIVNQTGRYYSRGYLRTLEAHAPFRFAVLNRQRRRLQQRRAGLLQLAEVYMGLPLTARPPARPPTGLWRRHPQPVPFTGK